MISARWLVALVLAVGLRAESPIQFEEVQWAARPLYEGSSVFNETLEGILFNSSNQTIADVWITASLHFRDGTLMSEVTDSARSLPPNGRWAFSMLLDTSRFPARPDYAKFDRATCVTAGPDGRQMRFELPVPSEVILSPENAHHLASLQLREARNREHQMNVATREFRKDHPCPSTQKTTGKCKGYYVDYVTPLEKGGSSSASNLEWRPFAHHFPLPR